MNRRALRPLYTPAMLEAAVGLAAWPLTPDLPLRGQARSRTCGSRVAIGLELGGDRRIARVGCRVEACAVGQSAAALFVEAARGRDEAELVAARAGIARWLDGGERPDWPGLALVEPALAYPARHGAILLAWDAALAALASQTALGR